MTDAALLELAERDERRHLSRLEREARKDTTPTATAALAASVLATVRAEPGAWSIRSLAEDYDTSPWRVRVVVSRLPIARRDGRLWPC